MPSVVKPAAIALGSNLGDRLAHVRAGVAAIGALNGTQVCSISSIIETPALLAPGGESPPQSAYLNAAVLVETSLDPEALLHALLEIERMNGRERVEGSRWRARTLDLDLLWYADLVIDSPRLKLPHPEMRSRRFVLEPLSQISPGWVHPLRGQTVAGMLQALNAPGVSA